MRPASGGIRAGGPQPGAGAAPSGQASLDAAMKEAAARIASGLLDEVVADARRDAAAVVRGRLTEALVAAMEQELAATRPAAVTPLPVRTQEEPAAWYLYGITRAASAAVVEGSTGIDGFPIEVVAAGPLAAVVSGVRPSDGWGVGPDGDVDLEALAPRARSHEEVLERLLDRGPVLPLRFGVVYPHLAPVRSILEVRRESLEAELHRLDGCAEWGLTLTLDSDTPAADRGAHATAGGRDYLVGRRSERQRAELRSDEAARTAAALHGELLEVAADAVVQPASGPGARNVVLRASYLVPGAAADEFRSRAEERLVAAPAGLGLTGELTGPWPPYHFCDLSLQEVTA